MFLSNRGKPFAQPRTIRDAFETAVKRAELKDVHFHDLRRSFATRKVTEEWDRDFVKVITGHTMDKVFARNNKPSGVTPVSHSTGLKKKTVLSA